MRKEAAQDMEKLQCPPAVLPDELDDSDAAATGPKNSAQETGSRQGPARQLADGRGPDKVQSKQKKHCNGQKTTVVKNSGREAWHEK